MAKKRRPLRRKFPKNKKRSAARKKPVSRHSLKSRALARHKILEHKPRQIPSRRHITQKPHLLPQRVAPERTIMPIQARKEMPMPKVAPAKTSEAPIERMRPIKIGSHVVSSGISGFDNMAGGGFELNSINLVVGGSGAGKSIFALQFLLEGLKKGEKVLYVTFEEQKDDFYDNIKHLGWDLEKAEKSGNFIFLEYSPEKVKMMLDEGGGAIESIVFKNKITRMVIDSITSFALLFDDEKSKRQAVLGLFDIIRKWNCTTLLTVQHNPTDEEHRGMSSFEFEADSLILLYYLNISGERQRFIEILKMRGRRHSKNIHIFKIDRGISIGPKSGLKSFG